MKIIQKPKCAECGESNPRMLTKCEHSMINGCPQYFCLVFHWHEHARIHEREWDEASEAQRAKWWNQCYPRIPYPPSEMPNAKE
jgi:hypothetical protein